MRQQLFGLHSAPIRFPFIIRMSLVLHVAWAALLWWEPGLHNITALYLFPANILTLSSLLGGASLLAALPFYAMMTPRKCLLCFFPQQIILYYSALGAALAAWNGSYGDGVLHPHLFIFGDQLAIILVALYHNGAIIAIGRYRQ